MFCLLLTIGSLLQIMLNWFGYEHCTPFNMECLLNYRGQKTNQQNKSGVRFIIIDVGLFGSRVHIKLFRIKCKSVNYVPCWVPCISLHKYLILSWIYSENSKITDVIYLWNNENNSIIIICIELFSKQCNLNVNWIYVDVVIRITSATFFAMCLVYPSNLKFYYKYANFKRIDFHG